MQKLPKILISILIAISIAVNPFCGLALRASAVDPVTIAAIIAALLKSAYEGFVLAVAGGAAAEVCDSVYDAQNTALSEYERALSLVGNEDGIYFVEGLDGIIYANYSDTLTGDDLEYARYFCNSVNEPGVLGSYDSVTHNFVVKASDYEKLKEKVSNSYIEHCMNKIALENNTELAEAADLPVYSFDFVGPMPSIAVPTKGGLASFEKDGYWYSIPSDGYWETREEAEAAGMTYIGQMYSWCYFGTISREHYAVSQYFIYNDEIFYIGLCTVGDNICTTGHFFTDPLSFPDTIVTPDLSKSISEAGYTEGDPYLTGYCFNISVPHGGYWPGYAEQVGGYAEQVGNNITIDDFTTTTGGGTIELGLSDDEQIVSNAIGLGLISSDSLLTIGEDGTITEADGIDLAKLDEIAAMLAEGNLQFEDIQQYLDLIAQLVSTGNMTEAEQKAILANLAELQSSQLKSLDEINTSIASLTEALTVTDELEDVESDFSYIIAEHHGLVEAQTLVETALPIVAQSKQLLTNVFEQAESAPDYVPNFSFYWDSNNDGVDEKYTAFDLSFMEHELNNSNLDDKNRFKDPMTVREFIQSLIVFIVYSAFLIKLLRRVPGLLGGSEGVSDDIRTIERGR